MRAARSVFYRMVAFSANVTIPVDTGEFQFIDRKVVEAVARVAARLGRPRAQVALAWVLAKSEVSAPIVGATRLEQLDDAVAALSLKLAPEDIAELEAPYVPHAIVGHA